MDLKNLTGGTGDSPPPPERFALLILGLARAS